MSDNIQEQIDEINHKVDALAEILISIRNTWSALIPDGPEPDEDPGAD